MSLECHAGFGIDWAITIFRDGRLDGQQIEQAGNGDDFVGLVARDDMDGLFAPLLLTGAIGPCEPELRSW